MDILVLRKNWTLESCINIFKISLLLAWEDMASGDKVSLEFYPFDDNNDEKIFIVVGYI